MVTEDWGTGVESSSALRRRLSKEERRQLATENEEDWRAFPSLVGTHFTWRRGGSGGSELVSRDGAVWATLRGKSISAFGSNYQQRTELRNKRRNFIYDRISHHELVDSEGSTVMSWRGSHYAGKAGTVLTIGSTDYVFPIRGSKYRAKTVMSAVQVGGSALPIARFRLTCGWYRAAQGSSPRPVEVVAMPSSLSTHHMALMIALASPWLRSYFDSPGGG
jgi:hypothetical protein